MYFMANWISRMVVTVPSAVPLDRMRPKLAAGVALCVPQVALGGENSG